MTMALRQFCRALEHIVAEAGPDQGQRAAAAMVPLLADDSWLPAAWAAPSAERYQQHLLYRDPEARFSVVSFVWGPGQRTPIHDHGVWGVVGTLRGSERSTGYRLTATGLEQAAIRTMAPGDIEVLDPVAGDIHAVDNALADAVSISIHAYGADIGEWPRRVFDPDGTAKPFISRYSTTPPLLESLAE